MTDWFLWKRIVFIAIHQAEPNSANSRIFQRWQNLVISFMGIVARKL